MTPSTDLGQTSPERRRAIRLYAWCVAGFVYVVLAVGFTWPLALHASSRVLGGGGDDFMFIWDMKWWSFALSHGINPLLTHYLFAPTGANLAWTVPIPLLGAVSAPFWRIMSPAAVYNLIAGIALVSSALSAFLLLQLLFDDLYAAILGGALYGFSPFVMSQALGHINLFFTPLLPLIGAAIYLYITRRLTGVKFIAITALLIALLFLIYEETVALSAIVAATATIVAVVSYWGKADGRVLVTRTAARMATGYVIAAILLLPYLITQFVTLTSLKPPSLLQAPNTYVIDVFNLFLPTPITAFGGKLFAFITAHYTGNLSEWDGYIGIFLLVLLSRGVYHWTKGDRSMASMASAITACVLILSFGPFLHVAGDPKVSLALPSPLGHSIHIPIMLPWLFLSHLPLLDNALPNRLMAFVDLGLAFLIADWTRRAAVWLRVLVGVCVFLTILPALPYPTQNLTIPPFFASRDVAKFVPKGANVLIFPIDTGSDPSYSGTSMIDQAASNFSFRIPDGYTGSYYPYGAAAQLSLLQSISSLQAPTVSPQQATFDLVQLNGLIRSAKVNALMVLDHPKWSSVMAAITRDIGASGIQAGGMVLWPLSRSCVAHLANVQVRGNYWPGPGGLANLEWMGKRLYISTHRLGGTLVLSGKYRPGVLGTLRVAVSLNGLARMYEISSDTAVSVVIPADANVAVEAARTWVPQDVIHNGDMRHISVLFKIANPSLSACDAPTVQRAP